LAQMRNSQQRNLIVRLLENNRTHPTADELYEMARAQEPKISRGTVYRNLNLLSDLGELQRLSVPGGPDHYDSNTNKHYHFFCRKCGRVFDAPIPYHDELNCTPEAMKGFQTESHRLLLIGLCPDCAENEAEDK
jgi:Fe2+ or Zn2+ uptake regulation protein